MTISIGAGVLDSQLQHRRRSDADGMKHFIRVESAFYPELGRCYDEAIERYFNKHWPADALIPDEIEEIVDWVCDGKTE